MNSLSGIRAINNNNRPVAAVRYQRQYKGSQWAVYDTHTNGFGFASDDVAQVDERVDRLNASYKADQAAKLHEQAERTLSVNSVLADKARGS